MEVLQNELRCRRMPIWGRKDQLASSGCQGLCCRAGNGSEFVLCWEFIEAPQTCHTTPPTPAPISAPGVYTALMEEGLGLSAEESEVVDAQLGLSHLVSSPGAGADQQAAAVAAGEAPSPEALAADPTLALQSSAAGLFLTNDNSERTLSNATGLQLSFLWGSTAPNGIRHTTSCVMRTNKSVWLFECGEDSQRHLVRCASNATHGWRGW